MLKAKFVAAALLLVSPALAQEVVNQAPDGAPAAQIVDQSQAVPSATARAAANAYSRARWEWFIQQKVSETGAAMSFCSGTSMPAELCTVQRAEPPTTINEPPPPPSGEALSLLRPENEPVQLARLVAVARSGTESILVFETDMPAGGVERSTLILEPGENPALPDGRTIQSVETSADRACVTFVKPHAPICIE